MSENIAKNGNGKIDAPQTALATVPASSHEIEVSAGFNTDKGFSALLRIAKAFAASDLVPDVYKGKDDAGKIANCAIAIEMAHRMGASPLMVMQNLYLVHGRPSWASQFLIAAFNNCGRFTALKYKWSGTPNTPAWGCQAYAREKDTGELIEGPTVTMQMAKAEGWIDKKGSKWQTMPQLMLTYRAAAFLIRTTAPELTMGLRTVDEQEDIHGIAEPRTVHAVVVAEALPPHDAVTGEIHDEGAASPHAAESDERAAEMKAAPAGTSANNPASPGNE